MTKVVFIMTDGLRPDAITEAVTPTLVHLMARASYALNARSVIPSITLPCHTSIFHSVPPARHGILDNNWHSMARPVPGLVEQLKAHQKRTAFIHNWEELRDLNRPGNLYFNFFIATGYNLDGDDIIARTAIQHLAENPMDFTFVYFASIDVAGHMFGWMSEKYLEQATLVDGFIQQVIAAVPDDMTVIIHSDHGGHERTHGTEADEDMTIPYFVMGPTVKQNYRIQHPVTLLDTAPTIAHLLNVPVHADWEGHVLTEIFD
jgi:predicted AlkP superfamily pyrophosphatase or phosphodiesterase